MPDLLMEESHPLGNAFRLMFALVGYLISTLLVGVSSQKWISDKNLYFVITGIQSFVAFFIIFFMKDVINSEEFKLRRKVTNSESKK